MPNDQLFTLLRQQGVDLDVVWEFLSHYYQIVAMGEKFPFKTEEELDKEAIAEAIQSALQLDGPPPLFFISTSKPYLKPEWMTEGAYRYGISLSLKASIEGSLGTPLWISFSHLGVSDNLEDSLRRNLCLSFEDALFRSLEACLLQSLEIIEVEKGIHQYNLFDSLFYYLVSKVTREEEWSKRLEGLVRVQTSCLVLGIKEKNPDGAYLVICG